MNRGLVWSAFLHGALFLLFLLGPRPASFEWDPSEALAVELVAAEPVPDPKPLPPPAPDPKPEMEPEVPEVSEPAVETQGTPPEVQPVQSKPAPPRPRRTFRRYAPPREEPAPSLAERLKERLTEAAEAPPEPERAAPESEAGSAAGASAEVEAVDFPYQWYLNVLRTKITAAWDPPGEQMLSGRKRKALVRFRVHRDGRITDVRVEGASGTPGLDASARRAVERGGPYPPLPPDYEADFLDVGVLFTVTEGA